MKDVLVYQLADAINIPVYEIVSRSHDLLLIARNNGGGEYITQADFEEEALQQLRKEKCDQFIDTIIELIEGIHERRS